MIADDLAELDAMVANLTVNNDMPSQQATQRALQKISEILHKLNGEGEAAS